MDGVVLDADSMQLPISKAPELKERYQRFIDAINTKHAGNIFDEAKAFLECIFRTIITDRDGCINEGRGRASFISLFNQAWSTLNLEVDEVKSPIKQNIELIGNFRNNFGAVAHGQDGYSARTADEKIALYIAREALSIAAFFYTQHAHNTRDGNNARLNYDDNHDFNEYIDSQNDCEVLGVALIASEVLFSNDPEAYKAQLLEFRAAEESEQQYYLDMWAENEFDRLRGK